MRQACCFRPSLNNNKLWGFASLPVIGEPEQKTQKIATLSTATARPSSSTSSARKPAQRGSPALLDPRVAETADEWDNRLKQMFRGATYHEVLKQQGRLAATPTKPGSGETERDEHTPGYGLYL